MPEEKTEHEGAQASGKPDGKLDRALAEASRNNRRNAALVAVLVAPVAALVAGLLWVGATGLGRLSEPGPEDPEPPAPSSPAPSPAGDPLARAADESPEPDGSALREDFKAALRSYEREVEPAVAAPEFAEWSRGARAEIRDSKEAALAAFGAGRYAEALAALREASGRARRELAERDAAFGSAMRLAREAEREDAYERALQHAAEALLSNCGRRSKSCPRSWPPSRPPASPERRTTRPPNWAT